MKDGMSGKVGGGGLQHLGLPAFCNEAELTNTTAAQTKTTSRKPGSNGGKIYDRVGG